MKKYSLFITLALILSLLGSCSSGPKTVPDAAQQSKAQQLVQAPLTATEPEMILEEEASSDEELDTAELADLDEEDPEYAKTLVILAWEKDATEWRDKIGQRFSHTLPPGGIESQIWGVDIYTDDSSIGSAAVHAGLISFEQGGTVTIEMSPGRDFYEGSARNGVQSKAWTEEDWPASFVFFQ
ncbi:MAG: LCCL domain-containing protein [Spirochaetia bacterium]|nr:LCCL domain-containing protein [Spirochaetia bacterium]